MCPAFLRSLGNKAGDLGPMNFPFPWMAAPACANRSVKSEPGSFRPPASPSPPRQEDVPGRPAPSRGQNNTPPPPPPQHTHTTALEGRRGSGDCMRAQTKGVASCRARLSPSPSFEKNLSPQRRQGPRPWRVPGPLGALVPSQSVHAANHLSSCPRTSHQAVPRMVLLRQPRRGSPETCPAAPRGA